MNHLKKFEEIEWKKFLSKFKRKVSDIIESEEEKFIKAVSMINIDGINFKRVEETNKIYTTFQSDVKNINVPLDGYVKSELWITKGEHNSYIRTSLYFYFEKGSLVYKIATAHPKPGPVATNEQAKLLEHIHVVRSGDDIGLCRIGFFKYFEFHDIHNLNPLQQHFFNAGAVIDINATIVEISQRIVDNINSLTNQDWDELKSNLEEICKIVDKNDKKNREYKGKWDELVENSDEISDLLIHLEEMSKSHEKKIGHGVISFRYEIPGIRVEPSTYIGAQDDTKSKFSLNSELIEVMEIIRTFKKRLNDKIGGDVKVEMHFENNFVNVVIFL